MREILNVHIGQAGVHLGLPLWRNYCVEHDVQLDGSVVPGAVKNDGFSTSFLQTEKNKCTPNAVLLDLDSSVTEKYRQSSIRGLFGSKLDLSSSEDASNIFPKGYYLSDKNKGDIEVKLTSAVEPCDSLQGFMLFRSAGGGTGSGLTACMMENLSEDLAKKCKIDVAIYPSRVSDVIEPYNAVLSTHKLFNYINCSCIFDNEALYSLVQINMSLDKGTFDDINQVIADTISTVTACVRFEGPLNLDLIEFQTNLVPFSRANCLFCAYAPLYDLADGKDIRHSLAAITRSCFLTSHRMITLKGKTSRYVACCLVYRGGISSNEINSALKQIKLSKLAQFVDWSPSGFKVGISPFRSNQLTMEGEVQKPRVAMIANSTSFSDYWKNINKQYDLMFEKAAFLHWYYGEGMELGDFIEARESTALLKCEYDKLKD